MYKAVVIDDNPMFIESVSVAVEWETLFCTLVGTAENGVAGKDLIQRTRPDIIIADINMPGLDGLTMIKAVRSFLPQSKIIIVTGYERFDYAQKAINLHVDELVLKPVVFAQFRRMLRALVQNLDTQRDGLPESGAPKQHTCPADMYGQFLEPDAPARSFSPLIKAFFTYIEKNACLDISLAQTAERLMVSPCYLSSRIKKETGKNYTDIILRWRVEVSKKLLRQRSYRIEEIAEIVGYSDYISFYKVFKRTEGISPKGYRQMTVCSDDL